MEKKQKQSKCVWRKWRWRRDFLSHCFCRARGRRKSGPLSFFPPEKCPWIFFQTWSSRDKESLFFPLPLCKKKILLLLVPGTVAKMMSGMDFTLQRTDSSSFSLSHFSLKRSSFSCCWNKKRWGERKKWGEMESLPSFTSNQQQTNVKKKKKEEKEENNLCRIRWIISWHCEEQRDKRHGGKRRRKRKERNKETKSFFFFHPCLSSATFQSVCGFLSVSHTHTHDLIFR